MATRRPERISLRVYPVGFGDCFLLGFHYAGGDDRFVLVDFGSMELTKKDGKRRIPQSGAFLEYMKLVADDIAVRCGRKEDGTGGQLHAVIATHRHADHINGFATKKKPDAPDASGDVIRSLNPRFVVQPWTEDPALEREALGPAETAAAGGPPAFAASLRAMQNAAAGIAAEAVRLDTRRMASLAPQVEMSNVAVVPQTGRRLTSIGATAFLGEDNISNRSAVENLIAMGQAGTPRYLYAGARAGIDLPGVTTHVLGPPTLKQTDTIRKQRDKDDVEFWMLLGATGTRFTAGSDAPFPGRGNPVPDHARWLRDHVRAVRAETLQSIVRILDDQMNNTSLVLLFEVGGTRLLFPGDAQIENWQYALSKEKNRALLAKTTLYKVGHHGSRNATPKAALWAQFKNRTSNADAKRRMWSVMSTLADKHGTTEETRVPRGTLVTALDKDTHFRTTQDFRRKEVDSRQFDVDPSTGRVTEIAP